MTDKTTMKVVPLQPGVHQETDRTAAPLGTLIAAVNARWRKGGVGKASALAGSNTGLQYGAYGEAHDGLYGAGGREFSLTDGRVLARSGGDQFKEVGRTSRFRPVKVHWLAFDESAESIAHFSVAVIGTTIAVAYTRFASPSPSVSLVLLNVDGTVRDRCRLDGKIRGGVVAVGNSFAWVYTSASTGAILMTEVAATDTVISTAGEVQVGSSATLLAANTVIDVAPYSDTHFLLAWRVANTDISVSRVALTGGVSAFQNVTCDNTALSSITVFGTDTEPVWLAFDDVGANGFKIAKFSAGVAGTLNTPTSFDDGNGGYPAGFCRISSTMARVAWVSQTNNASTPTLRMRSGTITGATVAIDTSVYHMPPASHPFDALPHVANDTTGSFSIWAHSDSGSPFASSGAGAWTLNRRYLLLTPSTHNSAVGGVEASGGFLPGVELSPDERASLLQSRAMPRVARRTQSDPNQEGFDGVRYYLPALAVLRTQDAGGIETSRLLESSALVLYEVEGPGSSLASDARARQVLDVGGRLVALGGHIQELYTQTPNTLRTYLDGGTFRQAKLAVENGFAFAPAILRADASAGVGLTADLPVSICAVDEYITPSGEREKSAPSNIVTVTPSGNNCQITLQMSSGAKTEREVVSPPNRVIRHVYATTGGGNVFQRVTPDASGYLATPNTGGGDLIQYVHDKADADVEDNEALYTDTGELPNQMSPAHRFGWFGGGRVVLGGLFDQTVGEMSKPLRGQRPLEFTRLGDMRFQIPEPMTAGGWLDGAHVIFSRQGAYLLPGPFPDETGAPKMAVPERLPVQYGCVDWRAVIETRAGLVFQSQRGLEILPRGFGAPRVISGPVQDALSNRRIISMTVTGHGGAAPYPNGDKLGESLLVVSATGLASGGFEDGVRLTFDLETERWISIDASIQNSRGEYLATWDGKLAVAPRELDQLYVEDLAAWAQGDLDVTVADMRFFDTMGRGRIHTVQVLGENRATINTTTNVQLYLYLDGEYSDPLDLGTIPVEGPTADKFVLEWPIRGDKLIVNAVGARIVVTGESPGTEDLVLHALGFEVSGVAGRQRVRQSRIRST